MTPPHVWPGPRRSIRQEAVCRGRPRMIAGCIALLAGEEVDPQLIMALAGPAATGVLTNVAPWPDYWLRVWGARGLLWEWHADATAAIVTALDDEAWRVREMAAKVVARHKIDDGLNSVVAAQQDSNARVRSAARRAVIALTS
ncbi:HEAT repeat protein [Nakamurella sp. UYEF19]|uniref:hypothetical protein n=1 Tax=Nakamurella sp. UYEF19 TaxID=1756392 RepID=UPI003391AFBD